MPCYDTCDHYIIQTCRLFLEGHDRAFLSRICNLHLLHAEHGENKGLVSFRDVLQREIAVLVGLRTYGFMSLDIDYGSWETFTGLVFDYSYESPFQGGYFTVLCDSAETQQAQ